MSHSPLAQYFADYHAVTMTQPASLTNLPKRSHKPISIPLHMYDRHRRSSVRRFSSLGNDSLLFPLLVVILCSSFRLCGTFLSLVCRFHVTFFYNWMANFMRNYTPLPAYNPATRPFLDLRWSTTWVAQLRCSFIIITLRMTAKWKNVHYRAVPCIAKRVIFKPQWREI